MIQLLLRNKLAWTVILLIAFGLPGARVAFDFKRSLTASTPATIAVESIDLPTTMQGKYLIGLLRTVPASKADMMRQLDANAKTPTQRVALATLAGEIDGRRAAIERLEEIGDDADAESFIALYEHRDALAADVAERYGFFARLAEVNGKPAGDPARDRVIASTDRAFYTVAALGVAIVGGMIVGFVLLVTAIILASLGKIRFAVRPPDDGASSTYVQGFAIYLALMLGVSIALAFAVARLKATLAIPYEIQYAPLVLAVGIGFAWPLLRGVSWRQVRVDYGLYLGPKFFLEPFCGVAGYLAGVPIIAAGMGLTMLLSKLSGAEVAHPIVKELFSHPIQIVFLAVVFAPLTEETLFRGAFVSHLRSRCNPWMAAIVSGVIFAAIHPQGWAAIPALGSIGFVLAMIRQWRGSLIASMTAHALNNAGAMTLVFLIGR